MLPTNPSGYARFFVSSIGLAVALTALGRPAAAQSIEAQIQDLRTAVDALRDQLAASRKDSDAMRAEIQTLRSQLENARGVPRTEAPADATEELLAARVDEQEQTKVESGSKYHARLSALALLNIVGTHGAVDNLDLPGVAEARNGGDPAGAFTAGVRQSLLGLEVFGPSVAGAKTRGELTVDLFGGFPPTDEGLTSPLLRLRTATLALEWANTSLIGGQDVPFFSPRSPTSLASTAYPALSSAGNMWTWTPQIHVDRRVQLAHDTTVVVQGGVLDPLTRETPAAEYSRLPTAGERSGMPAIAARVGWQRGPGERPIAVGGGAYYSRQAWGFDRTVHAWAATGDWDVPLGSKLAVSGELYRGRAIAGLGAGAVSSVFFDGAPLLPSTSVVPTETTGGWLQLKVKPTSRLEFNGAVGGDDPSRTNFSRLVALGAVDGETDGRNASGFVNAILQLRSNVLFSIEYRRLWTTTLNGVTRRADHVSLTTGIGF